AILEMLAAIVSKVMHWKRPQLTDFAVRRPLLLPEPDEDHARWQVVVKPLSADRVELTLYAAPPAGDEAGTEWLPVAGAIARPGADGPMEDWSIGYCPIENGRNSVF